MIEYVKCVNGWFFVLEEIRRGRGTLAMKTAYKTTTDPSRKTKSARKSCRWNARGDPSLQRMQHEVQARIKYCRRGEKVNSFFKAARNPQLFNPAVENSSFSPDLIISSQATSAFL